MAAMPIFLLVLLSWTSKFGNVEGIRHGYRDGNGNAKGIGHDYREALAKSILFFQGQRSGSLKHVDQEITWRGDSGLSDGRAQGVDLTGGYYDAGDNVKFTFPMAFTITLLSWGFIEYHNRYGDQASNATVAIRWGADYLLKCARSKPNTIFVVLANPNLDHACWERPENMTTDRTAYSVTPSNPGSDVAAEMAAALASASIVFRKIDAKYSRLLLQTAKNVMQFAADNKRAYSDNGDISPVACPFYCSYSGYMDELAWGAAWMHRATGDEKYVKMIESFGTDGSQNAFSWDQKYPGANVLLARRYLINKDPNFQQYIQKAENFMCKILHDSPYKSIQYTPGGLMYVMEGSNLQYVASATFLLTTYAKYMAVSKHSFTCGNLLVNHSYLRVQAKKQVDYILGDNRMGISYMVGYGSKYPLNIHHRGSSLPSFQAHPNPIPCGEGFQYLYTSTHNPNKLTGAIVGGPDQQDFFADDRQKYSQSEPTTYINAAIVAPLAYFAGEKR